MLHRKVYLVQQQEVARIPAVAQTTAHLVTAAVLALIQAVREPVRGQVPVRSIKSERQPVMVAEPVVTGVTAAGRTTVRVMLPVGELAVIMAIAVIAL